MTNDGFIFYRSYYDAAAFLPPEDRLKLYDAVLAYVFDGKEPELTGMTGMAWTLIKKTVDASLKRREAGKKGGRPSSAEAVSLQEERFNQFWSAYPRKIGKGEARKKWMRLAPSKELFEKILAAIAKAKMTQQWREDNGKYIPHPTTWLNQERWDDDTSGGTDNGTNQFTAEYEKYTI